MCSKQSNISYKIIQVKFKQVAQRATIAHLSPMCQGQSAPKPYATFPPPQGCYYLPYISHANLVKFDQDWPIGFRDIQVQKCEIFITHHSKMRGLIRPKIELNRAFLPVLVTSNFDDDSIKNERASMETPFSHYKSMGNFLDAQGQLTL